MAVLGRVAMHAIAFLFLFSCVGQVSASFPGLTGMWYSGEERMLWIDQDGESITIQYWDQVYRGTDPDTGEELLGTPIQGTYEYPMVNWSYLFGSYYGNVNGDGTIIELDNGITIGKFRSETCSVEGAVPATLADPSFSNSFLQSCVMCNWFGCELGCFCQADLDTLQYTWDVVDKTMLPTYSLIDVSRCPYGVLNYEGTLDCEYEPNTVAPTTPAPTRLTTMAPTTQPPTLGACTKEAAFPTDLNDKHCTGLRKTASTSEVGCRQSCCTDNTCEVFQWCPLDSTTCTPGCYVGRMGVCYDEPGWVSGAKSICRIAPSGNYTLNCMDCAVAGCTLTCKNCQNNQSSSLDLNTCDNAPRKDDPYNVVDYYGYRFAPVMTTPQGTTLKCLRTLAPTRAPTTSRPSKGPTPVPTTAAPVVKPTTRAPSARPTTKEPTTKPPITGSPSKAPVFAPTTKRPTAKPTTRSPTPKPSTKSPVPKPTLPPKPTRGPSMAPTTKRPTAKPTTKSPTARPTTKSPIPKPTTKSPTARPTTRSPTQKPTQA